MNKSILILLMICASFSSCKNNTDKTTEPPSEITNDADKNEIPEAEAETTTNSDEFEIESIPVSTAEIGDFPFIKLPEDYVFSDPKSRSGDGLITDYDKEYFYDHGTYLPVEGKTFKANIQVNKHAKDKTFSKLELQKSFDHLMERAGATKINSGEKLKEGEKDRLAEIDEDAYRDGYLHSCNNYDDVHTYAIRKQNSNIWIQYNLGNKIAYLTVLETKEFESKMSFMTASKMKQDLDEKGKAVLYINFDTDESTLKPDGLAVVNEIEKLMNTNTDLKIAIEGHTDNTGSASHNKTLSNNRANAVMQKLIAKDIDKSRLEATGFGSEKPLVANDTEENKAKNRRVEIVKI